MKQYNIKDFANLIDMSVNGVEYNIKTGNLKAALIPRQILITLDDIKLWSQRIVNSRVKRNVLEFIELEEKSINREEGS